MSTVRLFAAALLALMALTFAPASHAATRVSWAKVQVRKGEDAARVAKRLRSYLKRETRHTKWGKHKRLKLDARVKKLHWEMRGDVVLVDITVLGRIKGGKTVRSSIRLGGRPNERGKLEKSALKIVAAGLVTRLANITRKMPPQKRKRKKKTKKAKK